MTTHITIRRAPVSDQAAPSPLRRTSSLAAVAALVSCLSSSVDLGRYGFWFDEAFSVNLIRQPFGDFSNTLISKEANSSLYFVLLRLWPFSSHAETGARSLSVVFGALTAVTLAVLARDMLGWRRAYVVAVVFPLLPATLYATSEARGYSLLMLMATLSFLCLWRLVDGASTRWWPLSLSLAAGVYTHFYGLLAMGTIAAVCGFGWGTPWAKSAMRGVLGGLALSIPMLAFFAAHRDATQIAWLAGPQWRSWRYNLTAFGTREWAGAMLLGLAGIGATRMLRRSPREALIIGAWAIVPAVTALVYSQAMSPIFNIRYLSGSVPAVALLLAEVFPTRGLSRPLTGGVAAVVGLTLLVNGHRGPLIREDFRGADWALLAAAHSGDSVETSPAYLSPGVDVYAHGSFTANVSHAARPARVWLISIGPPKTSPPGYFLVDTRSFAGGVVLGLYSDR